jgi:hypothetical protein
MALSELLRVVVPVEIRQSPAPNPVVGPPQPEETIISIDASRVIRHSLQATATRNPVEQGSDITDHVILEPATLTVDGVITDSPIEFFSSITFGLGATLANITGQTSRSKQNFDLLQQLYIKRIPFSVNTRLKYYPNMIITSLDVPQDAESGQSINFTIQFQQITIVDTAQGGTVPGAGSGLPDGGANTARLGTLTTIATAAGLAAVAGALFSNP